MTTSRPRGSGLQNQSLRVSGRSLDYVSATGMMTTRSDGSDGRPVEIPSYQEHRIRTVCLAGYDAMCSRSHLQLQKKNKSVAQSPTSLFLFQENRGQRRRSNHNTAGMSPATRPSTTGRQRCHRSTVRRLHPLSRTTFSNDCAFAPPPPHPAAASVPRGL